jgi:acetyltransferase-like isoleucine patch superfamily enzyme
MATALNKPQKHFEDPLSFILKARNKLYSFWISAIYPFASKGRNLSCQYPFVLSRRQASQVEFGDSVQIRKDVWLNIVPDGTADPRIKIDGDCVIGARSTISAKNFIHFERDVITAASVLVQDHNHAYEDVSLPIRGQGVTAGGRIRIEQGCWIGQGAAIVCGRGELVIGRNTVVGANCVVTRSVPPYSVVVGNPARVVKQHDASRNSWVKSVTRVEVHSLMR